MILAIDCPCSEDTSPPLDAYPDPHTSVTPLLPRPLGHLTRGGSDRAEDWEELQDNILNEAGKAGRGRFYEKVRL